MANSKEFSHITVTADDDDDVVIQAGVVEEPAAEEPVEEAPLEEPVDEPGAEEADDAVAEAVEAAVEKEGAGETADAVSYHETTLDDLEATKMSTTQKVIIVVAVLGIVAFAAWYLLAH